LSPAHNFELVRGDKLSDEHPAENMIAEATVQMTMIPTAVLHVEHAVFMSRIKSRRTSRIVAIFEKPRDR
jgi:hypothetical protein